LGFAAALAFLIADTDAFVASVLEGSRAVGAVSVAALLAGIGALGVAGCAVLAWARGWWGRGSRLHYTFIALGALAFTAVIAYYRFVEAPLALLGWPRARTRSKASRPFLRPRQTAWAFE